MKAFVVFLVFVFLASLRSAVGTSSIRPRTLLLVCVLLATSLLSHRVA